MYVSKSMTFSTPHKCHSRNGLFLQDWNLMKRTTTYPGFEPGTFGLISSQHTSLFVLLPSLPIFLEICSKISILVENLYFHDCQGPQMILFDILLWETVKALATFVTLSLWAVRLWWLCSVINNEHDEQSTNIC
jgi:hypothetical protein